MLHWSNCYTFRTTHLNSANGELGFSKKHFFTGLCKKNIKKKKILGYLPRGVILTTRCNNAPLERFSVNPPHWSTVFVLQWGKVG